MDIHTISQIAGIEVPIYPGFLPMKLQSLSNSPFQQVHELVIRDFFLFSPQLVHLPLHLLFLLVYLLLLQVHKLIYPMHKLIFSVLQFLIQLPDFMLERSSWCYFWFFKTSWYPELKKCLSTFLLSQVGC